MGAKSSYAREAETRKKEDVLVEKRKKAADMTHDNPFPPLYLSTLCWPSRSCSRFIAGTEKPTCSTTLSTSSLVWIGRRDERFHLVYRKYDAPSQSPHSAKSPRTLHTHYSTSLWNLVGKDVSKQFPFFKSRCLRHHHGGTSQL